MGYVVCLLASLSSRHSMVCRMVLCWKCHRVRTRGIVAGSIQESGEWKLKPSSNKYSRCWRVSTRTIVELLLIVCFFEVMIDIGEWVLKPLLNTLATYEHSKMQLMYSRWEFFYGSSKNYVEYVAVRAEQSIDWTLISIGCHQSWLEGGVLVTPW